MYMEDLFGLEHKVIESSLEKKKANNICYTDKL